MPGERVLQKTSSVDSRHWRINAAAALIRQCLESTLDVFWRTRSPGMLDVTARDKWVCLPAFLGDRPEAREADFAWSALSNACHHRAYDVGLTQDELREHLAVARRFLTVVAGNVQARNA